MPRAKKGQRFGGRQKGTPNKKTVAREELALAQMAAARKAAGQVEPRNAMNELYKLMTVAEGFAGKLQPTAIENVNGKLVITGGDVDRCEKWFGHCRGIAETLAKYQFPQMKAVEAPAAPPDPNQQTPSRRFGLRVFEGGKVIQPLKKTE